MTKPIKTPSVIRDTREKPGQGWTFEAGTVVETLGTGDYTLKGYEGILCIERKGSVTEFAANLTQPRFERELKRMAAFPVAVVILEFEMSDIMTWPQSSTMSRYQQQRVRTSRWFLLQKFWELKLKYPSVEFQFVGKWGKEAASSLFKRVIEKYEKT